MRVRFEATLDEFIDVVVRLSRQQQAALPFWRRDPVVGAMLTAAVAYLAAGPPVGTRLIAAGFGLAIGTVIYPLFRRLTVKRYVNRSCRKWLGDRPTAPVELEPRVPGLWVAQNDTEVLYPWRDITTIDDSRPDVEINFRYEGIIIIRARAFPDAATRAAFLDELREYQAQTGPAGS
ncbi:MAG: hypothetical protein ACM4AI_18840 [Acidobacteriota bacterium]